MKYALIEHGIVTNTIALLPYNAKDFPEAVDLGERPVQIGDTYDGEKFYRNGKEVHTEVEEKDITIGRMNTAGAEIVQTSAKSSGIEPSANAGVFTYDEWRENIEYEQYDMFTYKGNAYFAKQKFTSSSAYPPDALGVEALYGIRPSPDAEGVYPYMRNMAVTIGMKVRSAKDGNVYVCYANATNTLVYDPVDAPALFRLDE